MKIFRQILSMILCTLILPITAQALTFDLKGTVGEELLDRKTNSSQPFVQSDKVNTPFFIDTELLKPVLRIKFDEGSGNTVKDEVSGKEFEITGEDYEWINDADIRVGSLSPCVIKQKSALKLNSSYINIGSLAETANFDEGFTIAFWTNFEIHGRNDSFTEPYYHEYTGVKTYGSYNTAYKYDKKRYNVILQSDTAKMSVVNNHFVFDGISDVRTAFGQALANNNFYNMYIVVVKKDSSGNWICNICGNDKYSPGSEILTGWNSETSPFDGNLYIGTTVTDGSYGSPEIGIADLMIFDKPLVYSERLELFYEYRQVGYYKSGVPED